MTTETLDKADADGLEARERLREAIAAVQHGTGRLAALQAAASRAREQGWHSQSKVGDAQTAFREAIAGEQQRLAYQFLNNDTASADPISNARAAVDTAKVEADKLDSTQAALSTEIENVKYQLRALQTKLHEAMMQVVINSDEYALLRQQHRDCFKRLRSIKVAMAAVASALHGQLPQELTDEARVMEPMQDKVLGYPVDRELVDAWQDALSQLEQDHETELPLFG